MDVAAPPAGGPVLSCRFRYAIALQRVWRSPGQQHLVWPQSGSLRRRDWQRRLVCRPGWRWVRRPDRPDQSPGDLRGVTRRQYRANRPGDQRAEEHSPRGRARPAATPVELGHPVYALAPQLRDHLRWSKQALQIDRPGTFVAGSERRPNVRTGSRHGSAARRQGQRDQARQERWRWRLQYAVHHRRVETQSGVAVHRVRRRPGQRQSRWRCQLGQRHLQSAWSPQIRLRVQGRAVAVCRRNGVPHLRWSPNRRLRDLCVCQY